MASAMDSGNATTATLFEKEGPAQSREASPFMELWPKQPKSLLPLNGADGLGREVVAHAADAGNLGGDASGNTLEQRPVELRNLSGHDIDGVDAADDAGPIVGALTLAHASMEMRRAYANALSYDLIICRTRCVSLAAAELFAGVAVFPNIEVS